MSSHKDELLNGRYRVEKMLAQGGMGAVYRAFDTLHDRSCALKQFRLSYLPSEDETRLREDEDATQLHGASKTAPVTREKAIEQFKFEARLLARLDHPNLPKVFDFFAEGSDWYLAMDLIEGDNLGQVLYSAGNRPLPEERVLEWMDQIMNALAYCHEKHVIHRDIKPANIVLTASGKAYLVDFGVAKPSPEELTVVGSFSSGYSAPELYGTGARSDAQSDIYSLGATMYLLLTGREPAEAPARMADENDMPVPRSIARNVSPGVDAAVMKALALRRTERFKTVAEMRAALLAKTKQPMRAAPPIESQPSVRAASPADSKQPKPRRRRGCWIVAAVVCVVGAALAYWIAMRAGTDVPDQVTVTAPARAEATVALRARQTATAFASQLRVAVGPLDGELEHHEDDRIGSRLAGVDLRDFVAAARFYNPYGTATGKWDYGFGFRHTGGNDQYRVSVQSDGRWRMDLATSQDGEMKTVPLGGGEVPNLNLSSEGFNYLRLVVVRDEASLFVNDEHVSTLDVSAKAVSGDIWIGTGMTAGREMSGKSTRYDCFAVWTAQALIVQTRVPTVAPSLTALPTATPSPSPSPTARPTWTPTLTSTPPARAAQQTATAFATQLEVAVGPLDGELEHGEDNSIDLRLAGVDLRDFVAAARFYNPYGTATGKWDYGFGFRHTGGNDQYRLSVQSDGRWLMYLATSQSGEMKSIPLGSGQVPNLDLSPNGSNHLRLVVVGDMASLFVNSKYVSTLDVSAKADSGDIWIGTGITEGQSVSGMSTLYEDFTVWTRPTATPTAVPSATPSPSPSPTVRPTSTIIPSELEVTVGPLNGELEHEEDGFIEVRDAGVDLRDFVVAARFYNPYGATEGEWDCGFGFRYTSTNEGYRISVQSDGNWRLTLIAMQDGQLTSDVLKSGEVSSLDLSPNGSNHVSLAVDGEIALLFVNGAYVSALDVSAQTESGDIWIGTGMTKGREIDGKSTRYEDFTIWTAP